MLKPFRELLILRAGSRDEARATFELFERTICGYDELQERDIYDYDELNPRCRIYLRRRSKGNSIELSISTPPDKMEEHQAFVDRLLNALLADGLEFLSGSDATTSGSGTEKNTQLITGQLGTPPTDISTGMSLAQPNMKDVDDEQYGRSHLQPVKDQTDKAILEIVSDDPDLKDDEVAAILAEKYNMRSKDGRPLTRQAINSRRRTLEKMGYKVR